MLPALCEELAFRGFILTGLRRRFRPWTAVFLSSFLFALFQMNVFQFADHFVLGPGPGRSSCSAPAASHRQWSSTSSTTSAWSRRSWRLRLSGDSNCAERRGRPGVLRASVAAGSPFGVRPAGGGASSRPTPGGRRRRAPVVDGAGLPRPGRQRGRGGRRRPAGAVLSAYLAAGSAACTAWIKSVSR